MLSNFPKVLKYAIGDRPYILSNIYKNLFGPGNFKNGRTDGFCERVIITGWRTQVYSSDGGTTGVQENYYTVKNILGYTPDDETIPYTELYDIREYELPESKLFSSKNHLLSTIKGKYLNSPYGNLTDNAYLIFSHMGVISGGSVNTGDWSDLAGMNFKNFDFTIDGEEVLYNSVWAGDPGAQTQYTGGELGGSNT